MATAGIPRSADAGPWLGPVEEDGVIYPSSDGKPIADNTTQFDWIVTIKGGLDALFRDRPDVFVAGDLLWYPVRGNNKLRAAPDAMVAFGRPKGPRGSYRQWSEGDIAPQVVFEILSPGNRAGAMGRKRLFYQTHGVEEYYIYDPDSDELWGYLRDGETLVPIPEMDGWVSPRLGIRFDLSGEVFRLLRPDGVPFPTHLELNESRDRERARAEQQRRVAVRERRKAEAATANAEEARARAEEARARAEEERARADRLAAQLRALGIEPDA